MMKKESTISQFQLNLDFIKFHFIKSKQTEIYSNKVFLQNLNFYKILK